MCFGPEGGVLVTVLIPDQTLILLSPVHGSVVLTRNGCRIPLKSQEFSNSWYLEGVSQIRDDQSSKPTKLCQPPISKCFQAEKCKQTKVQQKVRHLLANLYTKLNFNFFFLFCSGRIIRPTRGAIVQMALIKSAVVHKKLSGPVLTLESLDQEERCLKSSQKDRKLNEISTHKNTPYC